MTKKISFEYSRHHRALFKKSFIFVYRKQVRVDEIFLHENFTTTGNKANDIALLRLGKNQHQTEFVLKNPLSPEERVDLSTFPPVCLPAEDYNPEGGVGHVYGEEKTLLSMARRQFCFLWRGENSI